MTNRRREESGLTLIEALIVLLLVAISSAFASSFVVERVRATRSRVAADQLAVDLRSARLAAISNRKPVSLVVSTDPANAYEYTDHQGKLRRVDLPDGVRIVSSTSPITFESNGSVAGGASTVLETQLSKYHQERRTVTTNVIGIARVSHELLQP
jgi:Tfp pilus assembly protein FimT